MVSWGHLVNLFLTQMPVREDCDGLEKIIIITKLEKKCNKNGLILTKSYINLLNRNYSKN